MVVMFLFELNFVRKREGEGEIRGSDNSALYSGNGAVVKFMQYHLGFRHIF